MNASGLTRRRLLTLTAVAASASMALAACGGSSTSSTDSGSAAASAGGSSEINLVGFAVIKSAYDELGAAYAQTDTGKGVTLKGSYGASGAQSRAVIAGQKADLVVLSLQPDVDNIVDAGLIDPSWNAGANKGIVSRSVVVLAVRKGNPKGIQGWADIVKPGVGIVTADPGTSGAAKWNLLAAYAQAAGPNKDDAAGKAYLESFVKNVVSWNDSGRTATDAFVKGTGDVLISYENEAILARASGVELDYIVPESTLLIENPGAATKAAGPATKDFLTYVTSAEGQKILGSKGFRPIDDSVAITGVEGANDPANPFPAIANLSTIEQLGGWKTVNTTFFDKENGVVTLLRK
jgi:sulfate/thiosulfate transport system substrate-binding protein